MLPGPGPGPGALLSRGVGPRALAQALGQGVTPLDLQDLGLQVWALGMDPLLWGPCSGPRPPSPGSQGLRNDATDFQLVFAYADPANATKSKSPPQIPMAHHIARILVNIGLRQPQSALRCVLKAIMLCFALLCEVKAIMKQT